MMFTFAFFQMQAIQFTISSNSRVSCLPQQLTTEIYLSTGNFIAELK